MIPPKGLKTQQYPLRHQMYYTAGLNPVTTGNHSTYFTVARNYKTVTAVDTIDTNPKHASFVVDGGCVCAPMSMLDNLTIKLDFSYSNLAPVKANALKCWWQPIFNVFPEKLDAADEKTTTTVAALLSLVKDATEEDVTPLFTNIKFTGAGASDVNHPVSTVNLTETFTTLNMDTDLDMEGITHDDKVLQDALKYYTNKGALKSCLGRRRYVVLDENHIHKSFYIRKRPPSAVRRIMPYSFFGLLIHMPPVTNPDQIYQDEALAATISYINVSCKIRYDEWNSGHNSEPIDN